MDIVAKLSAQRLLGEFRRDREEKRHPGELLLGNASDEQLADLIDYVVRRTKMSDEQLARDSSREGVVLQRLADVLRADVVLQVEIGPVKLETGSIIFGVSRGTGKHVCFARENLLDGLTTVLHHAAGMRDG